MYVSRELAAERELMEVLMVREVQEAERRLFRVSEPGMCCQAAKVWPWLVEREDDK